mgnify:FL=1
MRLATVAGFSPTLRIDTVINSMVYSAKTNGNIHLYNSELLRPIIGMSDLSVVIEKIITHNQNLGGIYNIGSFNSSMKEIATKISNYLKVPIFKELIPEVIENYKLQSKLYDFSISTTKFRSYFGMIFKDSVESICQELLDNWNSMKFSIRITHHNYE